VTVAGLLLAAGSGSRLGLPKALLEVDGRTFVERGVALLRDAGCDPVVVVVGAGADQVPPLPDARTVVAADWAEGLGASLRAGLSALSASDATACVIALVDQPEVGVEAVRRLISLGAERDAVVATYDGQPRNPVLLSRRIWPDVAALAVGDVGARAWLRAHPDQVLEVACDDTGSPRDVDTGADLELFRSPR
jgi:CTP:molybdopterin cytidylyltransferase MocA